MDAASEKAAFRKEILKIFGLCVVWYSCSSGNGVVGKTILNDFPYPLTLTLCQLITVTFLSGPLFYVWRIRPKSDIPWQYYCKMLIPLALGKLVASVTSHISIWKVPVSYAHTVKATMPLFTVVLSRIITGEVQTTKVYSSLIPIIVGVLIATATELSFDMIGLVSALAATAGFSLQHIFSKKVLQESGIHHLWLLYTLAKIALMMCLPLWFIFDVRKMMNDTNLLQNTDPFVLLFLLAVDGFLNFIQNVIAFSVLSLVSPLTYSVCSTTKRILVITVSLLFMKNPITMYNFLGMIFAILGVGLYNKAKYDANKANLKEPVLPFSDKLMKNGYLPERNGKYPPTFIQPLEPFLPNASNVDFRII